MRKNNWKVQVGSSLVLLSMLLSGPASVSGNWGLEVGRADEGDNVRLLTDIIAMQMAETRIKTAVQRPLLIERRRKLLGLPPDSMESVPLDDVYAWWIKDVMTPVHRIAANPAASCAQAQMVMATLWNMMRQRSLLIEDSETERRAELDALSAATETMMFRRCREEALDECVATGRYKQIIEHSIGESRQTQLRGYNGLIDLDTWAEDAIMQCAIYELHFVSTSKIDGTGMMVERTLNGKIELKLEKAGGNFNLTNLVFYGQTKGGLANLSITCAMPGVTVTCSPGKEIDSGFKAFIRNMELKHREFFVDTRGVSQVRIVGEDKLPVELSGDAMTIKMQIVIPKGPSVPAIDWPAGGLAFSIAHKKDAVIAGSVGNVKFERDTRGVYPTIFEFTYADQNKAYGQSASDSTVFKLIHKPEPKAFPPRPPEPVRRPLKPRVG